MRSFSVRNFSKRIVSLGSFLVELVLYAGIASAYFFLVLHLVGGWIREVFDYNKTVYAIVALTLVTGQGFLLELLTSGLLWVIRRMQAIIPALRRLARPHETVIRPANVPGLLIYRFAGPLLFFNTAYFAHRVQELVDTAVPPLLLFLINAEAIVDMDTTGVEVLEELYNTLKSKNIALGMCEVKGNFEEALKDTLLPRRAGFLLYPSVAAAVRELTIEQPVKDIKAGDL